MRRRISVGVITVAICLGGLVFTQANAATKTVRASGGSATFVATVRNAKTCEWSSSPKIAGFNITLKCISGRVSRSARFKANATTRVEIYTITLTAKGATTGVTRWAVKEAGRLPPTTTTNVLPTTTTTVSPVTTTTVTQIFDQATSIDYFAFGSYNVTIGNLVNATEYADLTITGLSLSPGGGTVSFYDEFGNFICTGIVDTNEFQTVTGCAGVGLASAPATPIRAVYSGTQFGYNDGHGTSYAGAST